MSEDLKVKVKRVWEDAINQGNLEALDEVVARTCVRHQPPFPDMVGRTAIKNYLADFRAAYPDCHCTIAKIIIEQDWSAMRWTLEGTQTGVSQSTGAPPTGKHATMDGCTMARIEGVPSLKNGSMEIFWVSCNSSAWSRSKGRNKHTHSGDAARSGD
jgi:predicted ester cyclase